jgi:branched-chain amino acid transport system substrate-binding protein
MRRQITGGLLALVLLSVLLAGCAPGSSKGDAIVYVAVPLSGWQAEGGQTLAGGVRLMADELNKAGGLLGYRVKVVAVDDEADPDTAASVAAEIQRAVQAGDRVIGVIGHYNSGETSVAMETYKDLPFNVITGTASDVAITQKGYRNFFRVNATDAAQAPLAARFLTEKLGAQKIALIYADNDYGRGLRDQMNKALSALGQKPALSVEIKEAAPTQAQAVAQIKAAGPDAVFLAGYETEGYILLPELREAGVTVPFVCSDGCLPYAFIDESGPAAEGAYVSAITPEIRAVADEKWWKAYQQVENRNPGAYSAAGYSAMAVLAQGIKDAKSLDRAKVSDALHRLQLTTLVGEVAYDDRGDLRQQKVYVFQVQDGRYVQVLPAP